MYDFHVHSDFSMDCKYLMEEMVISAIDNNMKSICFTDHVDYDVTENNIDIDFRANDYFKKVKQVKYKYMKNIEILAGIEIGMQPHLSHRYNQLINNNSFDFVIMSLHTIDGKDIYSNNFTHNKDPLDVLLKYYDYLYQCINIFDNFDIVGHIDFIDRYFNDFSSLPAFEEYAEIVEQILKLIINKEKGIEVNTSGIRYGLNYFHPKPKILNLYKDLGGEIITIGSDAHSPEFIGYEYKTAEKLLREFGFKYIYLYKGRKKFPIHIG